MSEKQSCLFCFEEEVIIKICTYKVVFLIGGLGGHLLLNQTHICLVQVENYSILYFIPKGDSENKALVIYLQYNNETTYINTYLMPYTWHFKSYALFLLKMHH